MSSEPPAVRFKDDERNLLHVTWGRSGKSAIVSVTGPNWSAPRQCTLTPEQADDLARFLAAGPDGT